MDTNLALGRSYLQVPSFDFPTYSIHVNHGAHVAYADYSVAAQIAAQKSKKSVIVLLRATGFQINFLIILEASVDA